MQWFQRLMYGRRGTDSLNLALVVCSIVLTLAASIFSWFAMNAVTSVVYIVLQFLGTVTLVFALFRMFSRNIPARERENQSFLRLKSRFTSRFTRLKRRFADRKTYAYFKCPSCKAELRVPKGKGTIIVTCPRCKHETKTKT